METKDVKRRAPHSQKLLFLASCPDSAKRIPKSSARLKNVEIQALRGSVTINSRMPSKQGASDVFMITTSQLSDLTTLRSMLSPSIYSGEVMILPIPKLSASAESNREIELFRKTLEFLTKAADELAESTKRIESQDAIRTSAASFRSRLLERESYWFTSKQACEVEGLGASNPSGHMADRRERLEVFGIQKGREWVYPRFQWSESEGRPYGCMKKILEIEPAVSRWFLIRWFETPSVLLGGKRPVELVPNVTRWKQLIDAAEKNLEEAPLSSEPISS
jgi:hypothetical protein